MNLADTFDVVMSGVERRTDAIAAPAKITKRVIARPTYFEASSFASWQMKNLPALLSYWEELDPEEPGNAMEFTDFAKSQYDIFCATPLQEEENEEAPPRLSRSSDEAAAYEAAVPARGEI